MQFTAAAAAPTSCVRGITPSILFDFRPLRETRASLDRIPTPRPREQTDHSQLSRPTLPRTCRPERPGAQGADSNSLPYILRIPSSWSAIPGHFEGLTLELRRRAGFTNTQNRRRATPTWRAFHFVKKHRVPRFAAPAVRRSIMGQQARRLADGHLLQTGSLRKHQVFLTAPTPLQVGGVRSEDLLICRTPPRRPEGAQAILNSRKDLLAQQTLIRRRAAKNSARKSIARPEKPRARTQPLILWPDATLQTINRPNFMPPFANLTELKTFRPAKNRNP